MTSHSDPALNNNQKAGRITDENAFIFPGTLSSLTHNILSRHLSGASFTDEEIDRALIPIEIAINSATFGYPGNQIDFPAVSVVQATDKL
ncbi:MAG TPA: hypothetical protein VLZ28_04590, partial [Daejeonella sp.]|nr:hypothetical protein [Daejeonella sp.]